MELHTAGVWGLFILKQQQEKNVDHVFNLILSPAQFVHHISCTQRISVFSGWAKAHPSP